MTDRTAVAYSRLAVTAVLLAILAILGCRPAWSPDGRKLLFPARIAPAEQIGVALYDRDTDKATLLGGAPADSNLVAMAWSPDGKTAVVVTSIKNNHTLSIAAHAVPTEGEPRVHKLSCNSDAPDVFVAPPSFVGRRLFLSVDGIARLDLDSGEELRRPAAEDRTLVAFPRGDGLAYLQIGKGEQDTEWELGTVDPATLELSPLLKSPTDQAWKPMPMPAFDRDLARVAIAAGRGEGHEELAILVFRDGELETVLPVGNRKEVGIGSVHWANDNVTLLVSICRRSDGERPDAWGLYETSISGSVTRETTIVRSGRGKDNEVAGVLFPMALSPDGSTAAFSTAMIENVDPDEHGLYLLDLSSKERDVTRVPFPAR